VKVDAFWELSGRVETGEGGGGGDKDGKAGLAQHLIIFDS